MFRSSREKLGLRLGKLSHLSFHRLPFELRRNPSSAVRRSRLAVLAMDASNPAAFVNAELLRHYLGKRVRTVVQVIRTDGSVVHARSADGQQLILKGTPQAPLTTFVEVIGTADSNQSIRADIWTNFGDSFDLSNFNQICQLANGEFKHLFM